ncbi:hypothetical protein FSP39_014469 [Pinctada imbricata]|uniref:E3 UFM1-protein ligase 1 n=1 Tax=Pinctada imbricata TaxID=66713 RepID=A0AA89C7E8_PINIB|nr:hypothetical protein FSP39_014469 [Pinctada imbricata]
MADWEEVKRLAADFQRAQLSSTKQKLSERNVVELVAKLIELKLIDVIYTLDGKEYLTPQELTKEIRDELLVHGGRINLVDLQQILNVDFSHIETKVSEMVKSDKSLMLVLGQLVDKSYLDSLAEEVNDKLQEKGHVTIGEITKQYDLPADFISEHIHARVGRIVRGQVDSYDKNVIFTDSFLKRMKAQIRGAFSAITRPTTVMNVMNRYSFQERLFFSILEELIHSKRLQGVIVGGHQEKAVYIPDIYTKAQNQWVDNFYQQNGYLEYDSMVRLGITDPKAFIKKRFKTEPLTYLGTCCAGVGIKDQIEASVEEALAENSWADIMPLLPSVFSMEDGSQLLTECLRKHQSAVQCCHTIVTSHRFLEKCRQPFKDKVAKKAEEDARSNPSLFTADIEKKGGKSVSFEDAGPSKEDKRDQRRKKQAGATKSGGGTQGREVKTKATKKKYNKGRGDHGNESDEEDHGKKLEEAVEFMPIDGIEAELRKQTDLLDCPEEFITEIATQLYRPLCREYQEMGKSIFLTNVGVDTGTGRKKTHGELQEKIAGLWTNCKLFEKGLKLFSEDTEAQLVKHLLKSVCSDIVNVVVCAIGSENMISVPEDSNLTTENRAKIIAKLPENVQSVLTKLHTSLNGKTLDDFYTSLDVICGPEHLGVLLKKPDKRKERQLIFNHRQALLENIKYESDPAMLLHEASVILFQTYTQTMIHVPGKCVPQVIAHLQPHMEADKHQKLVTLQDLVVKHMRLQGPDKEAEMLEMKTEMEQLMSDIRDIVTKSKKGAQSSDEPTS